ncbi:uncharacterized protein [Anoplolepis gracilipes]|uniref:uncharacterized protein n=1 Tax=Anoplolepis gracilipes TaxID=354296 RepID=UPI003BA08019
MGLEVALSKTEAIWFASKGKRGPPRDTAKIEIEDVVVEIGTQLKYLGLVLDSRWSFEPHMEKLAPRMRAVSACLGRLMPNLGGPGDGAHRLYMTAVQSIALYGTPVWHNAMARRKNCRSSGVCRGAWPSVSFGGIGPSPSRRRAWWQGSCPGFSRQARQAYAPSRLSAQSLWTGWTGNTAPLIRTVQVLIGHGCFGEYLHRIGREMSATCHHCGAPVDTAEHTLAECQAWSNQRRVLRDAIGEEVSLATMVKAMVAREDQWKVAASFCGDVMSRKEAAEREKEADPNAPPSQRKRGEQECGRITPAFSNPPKCLFFRVAGAQVQRTPAEESPPFFVP